MIKRTFNSQGFEVLWNVPETVEEYNALATSRTGNPALDDALQSMWYRDGADDFRDALVTLIEKKLNLPRVNAGTVDEPKWENEGKYIKKAVVEFAKQNNIDPASNKAREEFLKFFAPAAQKIVDGITFNPNAKERTGGGNLVSKVFIQWATAAVNKGYDANLRGSAAWLAAHLAKVLNTDAITFNESGTKEATDANISALAKVIAANEKRKRDEIAAQSKGEYAIEEATTA